MARLYEASLNCTMGIDFTRPFREYEKQEEKNVNHWVDHFRSVNPEQELVGEILSWPRADGYAQYMIINEKPFTIAHLNIGDAWHVEGALIRGLRLEEARQMVERRVELKKIFSSRT